jgi:penicillin-binding protein 1A
VIYVEPVDTAGNYGLRQVPEVNGAIVAMDPHTGRVLALSGGFSYASSQFDRAMQAERQPGSSFKPFVYAAALDNGYTPVSKVDDAPISLPQGPGLPMWTPKNFGRQVCWARTTCAAASSCRAMLMTVRLASPVGMDKITPYPDPLRRLRQLPPYLSNAIGAQETTLMRMTTGYSEFVNGGKKINATLIDRIQDRNGSHLSPRSARLRRLQRRDLGTINPNHAARHARADHRSARRPIQIVSLLEGVVQRGTGVAVKAVGKPLAGKTGTSNEAKDVWFIGFSPDLTCGVFVGFDNPRTLGARAGRDALPRRSSAIS